MNPNPASIEGIIERTLHIQLIGESGTAFALDLDGQQYLVTAKHVGASLLPGETIRISSHRGTWVNAPIKINVSEGDPNQGDTDVAVLQMPSPLPFQSGTPILGSPEELYVTQNVAMPTAEVYSLFRGEFGVVTRTGTIAAIRTSEHPTPLAGDFLVGIEAYPGFSGSPVIYWDSTGEARLVAIATRLFPVPIQGFGPEHINLGFVGCFNIHHALELVRVIQEETV